MNKNEIGMPVEALGEPGPFTLSPGSLGFNEVRQYHILAIILWFFYFYIIMSSPYKNTHTHTHTDLSDCKQGKFYG